jgi:hypothetical protein
MRGIKFAHKKDRAEVRRERKSEITSALLYAYVTTLICELSGFLQKKPFVNSTAQFKSDKKPTLKSTQVEI